MTPEGKLEPRGLRYLSLFSGVEAATLAWKPLGWKPEAFAEFDAFPSAVLAHHYPNVPNLGDVTKIKGDVFRGTVDLVVGGSPCQGFSVAGKQKGLDDPRSALALAYVRLLDEVRPTWFVWENVPGVLTTNGGGDFRAFLGAIEKLGYHCAWRILDAQYVRIDGYPGAIPQRRRRLFVVGHLADWRYPAKVLFEQESLRGPSEESGGKGEAAPEDAGGCVGQSDSGRGGKRIYCSKRNPNGNQVYDMTHANDVIRDCGDKVPTLQARMGTGGNQVPLVLDKSARLYNTALSYGTVTEGSVCKTLSAQMDNQTDLPLVLNSRVRRLTPIECERLMGFPDDYTKVPYRGKSADRCPDAPRYKACGNSMCVNVMRWIGMRIQKVNGGVV